MTMPISFVEEGKKAKVNTILMNENMGKKLREMGIVSGCEIQVVKNDGASIILGLSGSRLALGMAIAQKIMVEAI